MIAIITQIWNVMWDDMRKLVAHDEQGNFLAVSLSYVVSDKQEQQFQLGLLTKALTNSGYLVINKIGE
jgi:hypothetical protein